MSMLDQSVSRRQFIAATGVLCSGLARGEESPVRIKSVRLEKGCQIEAEDGTLGSFAGSSSQDLKALEQHLPVIRETLLGQNALDRRLSGTTLWEKIYPGKAQLFADGRDALTGEVILNKPRRERHTATGRIFIAFSTLDVALWDLRGKLLRKPAWQIMGAISRPHLPVYWRPGEVGIAPAEAARQAKVAYDAGYRTQKWYFNKGAQHGESGFKENVELVRVLREALPDAKLMFDNHSIRYSDDVGYSVRLGKAIAPFKPFWFEEPICPEHVDGYARIKNETGLTIAGGEHWYTRWSVKPFLDRQCVDIIQSDPLWCGGISEWLQVCDLVQKYPGVKVVPHITSPWHAAPHCVASQSAELCPLLEYNVEGGRKTLEPHMQQLPSGEMAMQPPSTPGVVIGPKS